MASMSQVKVIAHAYGEAVGGDASQALRNAAEDRLTIETRLAAAERLVSYSFVRVGAAMARHD